MPMLSLKCNHAIPESLLGELSTAVAETIGKPEKYVMVVAEEARMTMSGEAGKAACVEVRSIGGLKREVNHELTMKICALLNDRIDIPSDRVYVTFLSIAADHWGWNKSTFG